MAYRREAFVGIEPAGGDGEMVAVVVRNGYSFTEANTRVFGVFRSAADGRLHCQWTFGVCWHARVLPSTSEFCCFLAY